MFNIGHAQLCRCQQQPRRIWDRYAICQCPDLVYLPEAPFGPPTPWSGWNQFVDPKRRTELIAWAKQHLGLPADPANVRDAVAAAREANEHSVANDIEFLEWVATL